MNTAETAVKLSLIKIQKKVIQNYDAKAEQSLANSVGKQEQAKITGRENSHLIPGPDSSCEG